MPPAPLLLVAAALSLGQALEVSNGHNSLDSILYLTAALALTVLTAFLCRRSPRRTLSWRSLSQASPYIITIFILFQLLQLYRYPPGISLTSYSAHTLLPFHLGLAAAALCVLFLTASTRVPRLLNFAFPALIATHFALGIWLIKSSPDPLIDVYRIHRESLAALLHGHNPYALTFANPYASTIMYGPGQVVNNRLNFGYPYPPLTLLLALPGYLLGGDYRYSQLVAMSATALCIAHLKPRHDLPGSLTARLCATLVLFTPRIFYVLEQGWTDTFVAMLIAATVLTATRYPRLLPLPLSLFLASKQYTFLTLPAAYVLLWPLIRKHHSSTPATLTYSLLPAAILTLPLALCNLPAFLWSCLTLQFHSPFRFDALSYLSFIATHGGPQLSAAIGFLAVIPVMILTLRGRPTEAPATRFALSVTLTYLVFFAFNKQAFSNYYYFVIAGLGVGAAGFTFGESAGSEA